MTPCWHIRILAYKGLKKHMGDIGTRVSPFKLVHLIGQTFSEEKSSLETAALSFSFFNISGILVLKSALASFVTLISFELNQVVCEGLLHRES